MSPRPGDPITLTVEKPAAGGRMIARLERQIVLVSGAIPGERVIARVERVGKGVMFAATEQVLEPSADRRPAFVDLPCGGSLYAHIAYARQLTIKSDVIADSLARLGRITLAGPVPVVGSPEDGYRMRARLHWRGGRLGLFREGSHDLCEARATRQLLPATCDLLDATAAALARSGATVVRELEMSENIAASERVIHLETVARHAPTRFQAVAAIAGVTGVTAGLGEAELVGGTPYVTDHLRVGQTTVALRRHACAFFQGNRYLLSGLVDRLVGLVPPEGELLDLYAGVGLFAVSVAATRAARVTAVEGDRFAAEDLAANATVAGAGLVAVHQPVEAFLARTKVTPAVAIVDPPRTGLSREALDGVLRLRPRTLIYVSCDVATLARDARRVLDTGYTIREAAAFDLFPNTPHVETIIQFET